jgi:phage terminase small subunit
MDRFNRRKDQARNKETSMNLTPKQQRFVDEYLIDLNGKQAAIRTGYSAATAEVTASRLLSNDKVAAAVAKRREKLAVNAEVTQERIVSEFARMAFYDPASIAGKPMDGPEDIPNLPEDVRRSIVGWGWDKAGNFTLKLADKNAALTNLGRHLGMFTDKVEATGTMAIVVSNEDAGL